MREHKQRQATSRRSRSVRVTHVVFPSHAHMDAEGDSDSKRRSDEQHNWKSVRHVVDPPQQSEGDEAGRANVDAAPPRIANETQTPRPRRVHAAVRCPADSTPLAVCRHVQQSLEAPRMEWRSALADVQQRRVVLEAEETLWQIRHATLSRACARWNREETQKKNEPPEQEGGRARFFFFRTPSFLCPFFSSPRVSHIDPRRLFRARAALCSRRTYRSRRQCRRRFECRSRV